ncbi:hypothetical protein [Pandoraea norimbergensis]|nr:hypothetical protein [Pandoraea norimbergensis]
MTDKISYRGTMKLFVATTTLLSVLLGMHGSAAAADAAGATDSLPVPPMLLKNDSPNAEHWTFSVSPYIWAAGIHGNVGQFGMAATHISSDFGTILKNVDLSFMAGGEARYGRYGLLADVMYGRVSTGGKFDVTSKTFTSFLGGSYNVLDTGRSRLDLVAGARVWYASTEIDITGGLLNGKRRSDSATWVDAVAGVRGHYFLTDNWFLTGWGVVGTGQADLDWDVTAALGYQFKESWSVMLGYRALGVKYNKSGFVYNVVQQVLIFTKS